MKRFVLPVLALALIPAAAQAQAVEVSGSVQVGVAAPVPPPPPQQPVYVQPQPQYVQPQPVYVQQPVYNQQVQPVYAAQPPYGYGRRMRIVPYNGGPVPPGAQLRQHSNRGLVVGGAVMFGISYGLTIIAGAFCISSCNNGWALFVPVAGPIITAASSNTGSYYSSSLYSSYLALGIIDTLVQAGGLTMLIVGAMSNRQELVMYGDNRPVRPRRTQWALFPGAPGANAGLSLAVTNF